MVCFVMLLAVIGEVVAVINNTEVQAAVILPLTARNGQFNKVYAAVDGVVYEANIPSVWKPTAETVLVAMKVSDAPSDETAIIIDCDSDEPTRYGSRLIGLDVFTASGGKIAVDFNETPIKVIFPRLEFLCDENIVCAHRSDDELQWHIKGCQMSSITNDDVICSCVFLGNYALVLQPNKAEMASSSSINLFTPFGLVISFASICVILLAYTYAQIASGRAVTHASISVAQVALFLLFFFQDDENSSTCTTAAILFHFFLQATFIWMAVAGALFYLTSHDENISTSRIRPLALLLAGWGCATIGVLTSVAVGFYGNATKTESCWLSNDDVFVWELIGPIVYMLIIKTLIICRLTWWIGLHERKLNSKETIKIRSGLRTVVVLEPFVCLLWIFGYFSTIGNMLLANVFLTVNTMQGFFVFYSSCFFDHEVVEVLDTTGDQGGETNKK